MSRSAESSVSTSQCRLLPPCALSGADLQPMLQTLARRVRPNLRSGDRACRFNESEANRLPGIYLVGLNKTRHRSSRTGTALTADWQERQKLVVHHRK